MKKTTLLSTAIFMLISLSYSQYFPISKHDWKTDNLKGQVKQYSICSYDASDYFGEIQKTNLNATITYKYDIKGEKNADDRPYSLLKTDPHFVGSKTSPMLLALNSVLCIIDLHLMTGSICPIIPLRYQI